MIDFFYTLVIFPLITIIEICYVFIFRVFSNHGIAILGVSIVISFCTLPLYFIAEFYQRKEKEIKHRIGPKINKIKEVFKGDIRYMTLSTYFRQNHYHPVYAIRSSLGLLIQVPFFIAAYSYLSQLQAINEISFFFIKDLSKPDSIISFHGYAINLLPIFMTLINTMSGMIYTKGSELKDKFQLYGISLLFLLLLYNSPAGLVLYWTMNNLFSLAKNILQKVKRPKIILFSGLSVFIIGIDIFLLFFHRGDLPNRLLAFFLFTSVLCIPFLEKNIRTLHFYSGVSAKALDSGLLTHMFILSCVILFVLNGIIVPSSLIASSVEEFSYIGSRTTPFPFILRTMTQGAGFFLFWPLLIYLLSSGKIRCVLTFIMIILTCIALIDIFLITENFGFFTVTMTFSVPKPFSLISKAYIINAVILFIAVMIFSFLMIQNQAKVILSTQVILLTALLVYSIIIQSQIKQNFTLVKSRIESQSENSEMFMPQYTFSKNSKNVLLILLDCTIGSYVPHIFNEKPELYSIFQGFHLYPNCISFANHTLVGALPIYGGYEYTPSAVNEKTSIPLLDKQSEAYLLLPKLFLESGYSITVTDPPFDNYAMSNLAIFAEYPGIDAKNLIGKYTQQWLRDHKDINTLDIGNLLNNNLIRFSFFKSAPLFLRLFIYDKGKWLTLGSGAKDQLTDVIINDYAFLDSLLKITSFLETGDTFTSIYAHLPHDSAFLQAPDYVPVQQVTNKGSGPFAEEAHFHVMTASFLLLGKWFEYLKTNNVYDNTRIVIVSDHGSGSGSIPENMTLPNGSSVLSYNPLLMIKDFDSTGNLVKSDDFMTNGDVPLLILRDLIDKPKNPFTGIPLETGKESNFAVTTIGALSTYRHTKFIYNIGKNQWLYVKDNIFDPANWSAAAFQP
jgi:YidC/Oxa1 family membrane protein insertase